MDRLQRDLHLKPDQSEKVRPILRQMVEELDNLRSLNLRETEGNSSRSQHRMSPVLESDQSARLQEIIEERRQRLREWLGISESSASQTQASGSPYPKAFH